MDRSEWRWQSDIRQRKRRKRFEKRRREIEHLGQAIHHSQTHLPDHGWPNRSSPYVKRGQGTIRIPEVFSFIENPKETIDVLDELDGILRQRKVKSLYIDHSRCKMLDLCASLTMDNMIMHYRRSRRKLGLSGRFSNEEKVNLVLRASGLLKRIRHDSSVLSPEIQEKVKVSDLYQGYSKHTERSSRCDEAATELTDYFDGCLKVVGTQLSPEGKRNLSMLITEVISNSEEHSRGRWYAKAHFDSLNPEADSGGTCHLVLMNLGPTIYNSFSREGVPEELTRRMKLYSDRHLRAGGRKYDEEALWSLFALQEGITSRPEKRGNGTTHLIDFFLKLSGKMRKMCIISGHAFIFFDGEYRLETMSFEGGDRQVIAFNKKNSLEFPPDEKYVSSLPKGFPGTLISMKFDLKKSYAEPIK